MDFEFDVEVWTGKHHMDGIILFIEDISYKTWLCVYDNIWDYSDFTMSGHQVIFESEGGKSLVQEEMC